jgi:tRNA(fMet)-specific endonuclease VapC
MIFLLDTDTLIFLMRGIKLTKSQNSRKEATIARGLRIFEMARHHALQGNEIALSAITVAEVEFGARKSDFYEKEMEIFHRVTTPFSLLDFDALKCAMHYGKVRQELESKGKNIGSMDLLIAAHALAIKATIVTNNTVEFGRVTDLKMVNWSV